MARITLIIYWLWLLVANFYIMTPTQIDIQSKMRQINVSNASWKCSNFENAPSTISEFVIQVDELL